MDFEDRANKRPDDSIIEYEGFEIVCDPKSLLFIFGMQLDYSDALIGGGFSFKNPNATQTCGCETYSLISSPVIFIYGSQMLVQKEYAFPVRHYAKASAPPALKGDQMLKNIFVEVKNKFETAIGILKSEKITIDPEDPAAVAHYAKVMKTVREKANLLSESQDILAIIETETQDIPDARTYLLTLKEIRTKRGLTDDLGAEAQMIDALDKVEKELKKPLLRNDTKGMDRLLAEFDKINKKLGVQRENLPKYEEELELKLAKAQLEELKKDALEAMETQKKREEFKDEPDSVDVKTLDIRNFL
ncbi:iron-sulfur cluster assembly protein [Vigna unguiculata]|uniref:Iron-sulfur cluster assembly protein n=1 Tax=Vigna unguiculata TaxID=3917 RepID=A0A4D6L8C1_VIGUN|nr:iron-sulfur cluster assembly protein [Vigna unguiculata]